MPKRKRNDGAPKTVCQHYNREIRTNSQGEPEWFCLDENHFVPYPLG